MVKPTLRFEQAVYLMHFGHPILHSHNLTISSALWINSLTLEKILLHAPFPPLVDLSNRKIFFSFERVIPSISPETPPVIELPDWINKCSKLCKTLWNSWAIWELFRISGRTPSRSKTIPVVGLSMLQGWIDFITCFRAVLEPPASLPGLDIPYCTYSAIVFFMLRKHSE